jgi:hypothetical protein
VLIAAGHHLAAQLLDVDRVALPEEKSVAGDITRRCEPVQRRRRRHNQHVDRPARLAQAVQRRQTLGDKILVRRQRVVGQRLPVGQGSHRKRRVEVRDFVDEALRVERIGSDDDEQAPFVARGVRGLRQ